MGLFRVRDTVINFNRNIDTVILFFHCKYKYGKHNRVGYGIGKILANSIEYGLGPCTDIRNYFIGNGYHVFFMGRFFKSRQISSISVLTITEIGSG